MKLWQLRKLAEFGLLPGMALLAVLAAIILPLVQGCFR